MPLKKINRKNKTLKKQAPKKNAHKRTHRQRPKNEQTQTQNVYINTYRQQRAQSSVRKSNHNTISTPIIVPFVQPLPPGHPFNSNAPHNQSGLDAHNPLNPTVPSAGALAAHVGAVPATTPTLNTAQPQTPAPQTPAPKKPKQKRGKNILLSNIQDGSAVLPTLESLDDNLNGLGIDTLNAILNRDVKDQSQLFKNKKDRNNKQKVESATKKARDLKRIMLEDNP